MKRTFLVVSLCLLAGFSFAQKKAVKEAKSAMNSSNIDEARTLIKPALTDPETANDQETWKLAGDIEYKLFDSEKTKEMTKDLPNGKPADEVKMYEGLYNLYAPYIKADELGEIPDPKNKKPKNKVRKDIARILREVHPLYINGGIYYNDKRDYAKAADYFEKYWELPGLALFSGDLQGFNIDSTYQTIKYYAVISAIQSEAESNNKDRSIKLLNKIIAEPYITNSTYKESDPYELLASQYAAAKDSVSYMKALQNGANKFPANQYFTPNLINELIKKNKSAEAMEFLDQAIANDSNNACDLYSVKASLFAEKKDYPKAESIYNDAITSNSNCERALEGLGILYIVQAQDIREKAGQAKYSEQRVLDEQANELYRKARPLLEKYIELLKSRNADKFDIKQGLAKLQNVYYNLNLAQELDAIVSELETLKDY